MMCSAKRSSLRFVNEPRSTRGGQTRAPDPPQDAHAGAESRLDADAAIRSLAPHIAALPKRDRDTLLLYAFEDLTYEQISVALDVPVGTVRSRLNRVRRKLAPFNPETGGRPGTNPNTSGGGL